MLVVSFIIPGLSLGQFQRLYEADTICHDASSNTRTWRSSTMGCALCYYKSITMEDAMTIVHTYIHTSRPDANFCLTPLDVF